jgi:predicted permease
MIFYLFQIHIPAEADTYLVYIGSVCTPMAMIFIGSTLVGTNILQVMKDRLVLESAINKTLILPLISYIIVVFLPISGIIKAIIVFAACFPSAALASVVVETEGKNSALACKILVVSTAISIVSLPLAVELIHLFIL